MKVPLPLPLQTRLAPSPTGALHLGNARTFLMNAAVARQAGTMPMLRVDDLEGPRIKSGAAEAALEDLRWLGINWTQPVLYQSSRATYYEAAATRLEARGLAYRCDCPRAKVATDSPGTASDGGLIYSGFCRARADVADPATAALRFHARDMILFNDVLLGVQQFSATDVGDFVIRKRSGEIGYQLASVIDDLENGFNFVLRGQDLLASTGRQAFLYKALDREASMPTFAHVPLVVGEDGLKLAKRHGDTRLAQLREEGVSAGRVRAVLGQWSGFTPSGDEITFEEWVERFDLKRVPPEPVTYVDERDRRRLFS